MTREILLPATSGRISVTQFDVLDSDRPCDAACDKRDVCQGTRRAPSRAGCPWKAEANLALCGEVDAVLTPAHPGRLRSSQRRAAKNHPIFRNNRRAPWRPWRPRHSPVCGPSSSMSSSRWSHRLSADAAEIVDLTIAGGAAEGGRDSPQTLSQASGVNQSGAHAARKVESRALLASSRERFLLPTGRPPSRERENRQILRCQWVRGSVALPALSRK
jgi:hypothetical protein